MLTRKKKLIYTLVFHFGYDECELVGLNNTELGHLVVKLRVAEKIAQFNNQKPVKLPAGRLNGSIV